MTIESAPSRLPLDPKHSHFMKWVEEQGIEVNGIEPANLEGRGTGIVQCLAQSTEVRQSHGGREVRACLRCSA